MHFSIANSDVIAFANYFLGSSELDVNYKIKTL